MTEGIVSLENINSQYINTHYHIASRVTQLAGGGTYGIRDEASSLDAGRLDSLEEVDHTLCLESLQLGMETDECPCPPHSITEGERERGEQLISHTSVISEDTETSLTTLFRGSTV